MVGGTFLAIVKQIHLMTTRGMEQLDSHRVVSHFGL